MPQVVGYNPNVETDAFTNRKTTGVRIIPVPGAKFGDFIDFGGLFGSGTVTQPACPHGNEAFIHHGGHIPAPIHSLNN